MTNQDMEYLESKGWHLELGTATNHSLGIRAAMVAEDALGLQITLDQREAKRRSELIAWLKAKRTSDGESILHDAQLIWGTKLEPAR